MTVGKHASTLSRKLKDADVACQQALDHSFFGHRLPPADVFGGNLRNIHDQYYWKAHKPVLATIIVDWSPKKPVPAPIELPVIIGNPLMTSICDRYQRDMES